jgi:hypothetical protein
MINTWRIGLAVAGLILAALLLLLPGPCDAAASSRRSSAPAKAGHEAASGAETAPLTLTLELQPADVSLSEGTSPVRRLFLVAHSSDKAVVGAAKLHVDPPDGVTARVTDAPTVWPRSGDLVWTIEVGIDNARSAGGKLVVLLTYEAGAPAPPAVAMAVATIEVAPAPDLTSTVKTALVPAEGSLDEFNPLDLSVQITNTGLQPVAVGAVKLLSPPYVRLDPEPKTPVRLESGQSVLMPLTLKTATTVLPGSYALVFSHSIGRSDALTQQAIATVQGKVTIGIPGVSDAMQLLGIPSLLLLPGILTVLGFIAAWALLTGLSGPDWKNPGLLLLAIGLSFGYAFVYPYAVQWVLHQARDYLHGYDLRDIIYVWAGSIAVGVALAILASLGYWGWIGWRYLQRRRTQPTETDTPDVIIEKLARQDATFSLPRLRLRQQEGAAPDPATFLPLPFGEVEAGQRWVVRQGIVRETGAGTPRQRNAAHQCLLEIRAALADAAAPGSARLWRAVKRARGNPALAFEWDGDTGPRKVNDADYIRVEDQDAVLRREA